MLGIPSVMICKDRHALTLLWQKPKAFAIGLSALYYLAAACELVHFSTVGRYKLSLVRCFPTPFHTKYLALWKPEIPNTATRETHPFTTIRKHLRKVYNLWYNDDLKFSPRCKEGLQKPLKTEKKFRSSERRAESKRTSRIHTGNDTTRTIQRGWILRQNEDNDQIIKTYINRVK